MKILLYSLLFLTLSGCWMSQNSGNGDGSLDQVDHSINSDSYGPLQAVYCDEIYAAGQFEDTANFRPSYLLSYEMLPNCICAKFQFSGCNFGEPVMIMQSVKKDRNETPEVRSKILVMNPGQCDQLLTDSACFSLKRIYLVGNEVLLYLNNSNESVIVQAPQN